MLQQGFNYPQDVYPVSPPVRSVAAPGTTRRKRIVVRKGVGYIVLLLEDVVLFYTDNKITYAVDRDNKKYIGENNLGELEMVLDKQFFFRANRQYILNIDFIKSYKAYEKVKLQVQLNIPEPEHLIIVSQETAPEFRQWMSQA
jgi:DNA-binding LytR/AlgR family response regulator